MSHQIELYTCVECEGMFKLLPNGSLGRCYLLRSSAGDCIELTCLPVAARNILNYFNSGISEEHWKLYDMFDYEITGKEENRNA